MWLDSISRLAQLVLIRPLNELLHLLCGQRLPLGHREVDVWQNGSQRQNFR